MRGSEADGNTVGGQSLLRLPYAVVAVVEDRGAEDGVGVALRDRLAEVRELAGAAGGDHRHADRVGNRLGQLQVVAVVGAVSVHAGQQDLTGAALDRLLGPGDGAAVLHSFAAAVDIDAPGIWSAAGRRRDRGL